MQRGSHTETQTQTQTQPETQTHTHTHAYRVSDGVDFECAGGAVLDHLRAEVSDL